MPYWDGMVIQRLSGRVNFGVIGSNLLHLTNGGGGQPTFWQGFEGWAWGIGSIAVWVAKAEKPEMALRLRWVNEVEVTNLLQGGTLELGAIIRMK